LPSSGARPANRWFQSRCSIPSNGGAGGRPIVEAEVKATGAEISGLIVPEVEQNRQPRMREPKSPTKDGPLRVRETDCGRGRIGVGRVRRKLGEGMSTSDVLDQTALRDPGVREDGMLGRNGRESPEPPAGRLGDSPHSEGDCDNRPCGEAPTSHRFVLAWRRPLGVDKIMPTGAYSFRSRTSYHSAPPPTQARYPFFVPRTPFTVLTFFF